MNEEIKEILDYIDDRIIPNEKWNKIKDYITELQKDIGNYVKITLHDRKEIDRLQQENEELNRMCELYSKSLYNAELTDYKSRLEKASNKLDSMFANGEENKILDDLLELNKIVKGDK